jgi:hypothetical protein
MGLLMLSLEKTKCGDGDTIVSDGFRILPWELIGKQCKVLHRSLSKNYSVLRTYPSSNKWHPDEITEVDHVLHQLPTHKHRKHFFTSSPPRHSISCRHTVRRSFAESHLEVTNMIHSNVEQDEIQIHQSFCRQGPQRHCRRRCSRVHYQPSQTSMSLGQLDTAAYRIQTHTIPINQFGEVYSWPTFSLYEFVGIGRKTDEYFST